MPEKTDRVAVPVAVASTEEQRRQQAEQARVAEEAARVAEQPEVEGGRYLIGGVWMNADGKPVSETARGAVSAGDATRLQEVEATLVARRADAEELARATATPGRADFASDAAQAERRRDQVEDAERALKESEGAGKDILAAAKERAKLHATDRR